MYIKRKGVILQNGETPFKLKTKSALIGGLCCNLWRERCHLSIKGLKNICATYAEISYFT